LLGTDPTASASTPEGFPAATTKYVSFEAAAKALGISQALATKAALRGELRTSWMGRSRVVSVRSLMQALGIADVIVHPDDVENGAASAGAG